MIQVASEVMRKPPGYKLKLFCRGKIILQKQNYKEIFGT